MAAITPYSTPAEQPVVDTYVPIPFQEMMQAGAITQARHDEAVAMEDTLSDQLGAVNALRQVEVGGQYYDMPDYDVVTGIKDQYEAKLDDLASTIPDKSNPEYRAKLKSLMGSFKRDLAPTGRIGIAMSNIKSYQDYQKQAKDNPQLMEDPSLYMPFLQKMERYKQGIKSGDIQPLDLSGAIGESVDINKELSNILKNMKPTEVEALGLGATSVEGIMQALSSGEVSLDRISNAVQGLIQGDSKLANTMARRASYKKAKGDPRDIEDIIAGDLQNSIRTMQNVFYQSKQDRKFITDPLAAGRAKKLEDDLAETFSFTAVDFKKGTQIATPGKMDSAKRTATTGITHAKEDLQLYLKDQGIEVDEKGNPLSFVNADGVDKSDIIQRKLDNIQQSELELANVEALDARLKEKSKWDLDQYIKDNPIKWAEAVEEAKVLRSKHKQKFASSSFANPYGFGEKEDPAVEQSIIKNYATELIKEDAPRYKEYKRLMEEEAKSGTFEAGVLNLPSDMGDTFGKWFAQNYQNFDTSIGDVQSTRTGESYTKDKFDKVVISDTDKKFMPGMSGFSVDADGTPRLRFTLKDENGKVVDHIKVKAPDSFVTDLIDKGKLDQAAYVLNKVLSNKFGAFGSTQDTQTVDANMILPTSLQSSNSPKVTMRTKNIAGGGGSGIEIDIVDSKGNKISKGANSKLDAIAKVRALFMDYAQKRAKGEVN